MESVIERIKSEYPEKFLDLSKIFSHIRAGDRIFVGTGCGEPQYLVNELIKYAESKPKAFFDTEIIHIWTLGVAPYTDEKFKHNFRHNSFFIAKNTREVVNRGLADYTPILLSKVPSLFRRGIVPIDVALIQVSMPDKYGYVSLGISVDVVKAAAESAKLVIAQVNSYMPRVHGDSFLHVKDIDYLVHYDEPLLEFKLDEPDEVSQAIGKYVAQIVQDGDTIQVGYGDIPNAVLANLEDKKHLGVHTELLTDGIVNLIRKGVVDNSRKTLDRGKTVAAFCMGSRESYEFLRDNPGIEFRGIDYTNNPLVIAQQHNITAINTALQIDLTGQATAESLGRYFYSGIGGQADFMRGAALAPGGKTVLALPSTAEGGKVSRIVPFLKEGTGVTLGRGDVAYVVTEYGRAYLVGKNIRERAMALISIAHPRFRGWLIEEARKMNLIYPDQAFIPGKRGEYPRELEVYKTTKTGLNILLRPVKISDEPLLKDFFYGLSEQSKYKRFITMRKDMPHEMLQEHFVVIDYTEEMEIVAVREHEGKEEIIGLGEYRIYEGTLTAEVGMVVSDEYQNKGVGSLIMQYLIYLAKKQGLLYFRAEYLPENLQIQRLLRRLGFEPEKSVPGVYAMRLRLDQVKTGNE